MQSHSEPGRIQVTEATYSLVKEEYHFESRGKLQIKGKGAMSTYFVSGEKNDVGLESNERLQCAAA
jgi:class 3 adenylate cyclase